VREGESEWLSDDRVLQGDLHIIVQSRNGLGYSSTSLCQSSTQHTR
jgi:hypothetical protein